MISFEGALIGSDFVINNATPVTKADHDKYTFCTMKSVEGTGYLTFFTPSLSPLPVGMESPGADSIYDLLCIKDTQEEIEEMAAMFLDRNRGCKTALLLRAEYRASEGLIFREKLRLDVVGD